MRHLNRSIIPGVRVSIVGFILYVLGAAATVAAIGSWHGADAHDRPFARILAAGARSVAGNSAASAAATLETGSLLLAPQDTWLNINTINYSSGALLRTYTWPDYQTANAILMKFDLSTLPAGAVVEKATLNLALVQSDAAAESTYTVTAHKLVGKNPDIAKATGYTADGAIAWTPNACCHDSVPLAQADISTAYDQPAIDKAPGFKAWDITTMVQEWLVDTSTNFGLLLNADASKPRDRYRYFASMQHSNASLRPYLEVVYAAGDATPPSAAITAPAAGAILSGTVPVAATATDNVGIAAVQFQLDGAPLGAELTSAPFTVDWDTTTASDGAHVLSAVARDWAGNPGAAAAVSVIVKNAILLLSPQDTSLNINTSNYSADTVLTTYTWPDYKVANTIVMKFDLSAVPPGAFVERATVHLALVESDATPDSTYSIRAHKLVGKNPVISLATGYTADAATTWTANACCYNAAPLAQANISPAYDIKAIDKTPGFKAWTITTMVQEWLDDPATNFGLLLNSDDSTRGDRYRFFASMEHTDASLRPHLKITYSSSADATPPSVSIVSPAAGATVSGTVAVTADASDDVAVVGVQFKLNSVNLGVEDTSNSYSVSWDTSGVVNGSYTVTAVARDAAGNVTTSPGVPVTVSNDTTPPAISSVSTTSLTASGTTIDWTTNEASDSQVEYGLTASYGSATTLNPTMVSSHSAPVSGLAANTLYHFRVRSRDAAGNLATSGDFTFITFVPADVTRPSVSITAPPAGATVSGTTTVSATASDDVAVVGVQFRLDDVSVGSEDLSSPYSVSWNSTMATNGSHALTAIARDAAGNQTTSAAVTVNVSNPAPPPSGGIATRYPGDVGIETDANVVFVERFDESSLTNLFGKWTDILNGSGMSFSADAPAGSPLARSLNIPWSSASGGGHLYRPLSPGVDDTLYVRYYVKYPTSGSYQHEGVWMGGYDPPLSWPNPQAGLKPTGSDRFSASAEQSDDLSHFDHYDYWMNMRKAADGNYWGNTLLNNPNLKATPGQWMCVEHMVKLNTPVTAFNGEHAIWINGAKVSHLGQGFPNGYWSGGNFIQDPSGSPFEGFKWRSTTSLNLNWLWLQVYAPNGGSGSIKYAHVVAAKSYIGCLASGSPDTIPPTVSLTSPSAGATVSGTITVSAGASDNVGVTGVQFKLDGVNNLGVEDTTSPYSISWDTTTAANGTHTLTSVARDPVGNQTTSAPVSVSVNNPSGGSAVFTSNWDTATGTSTTAVTDGGRWPNYWEFNNGSNVQLLSVVSGGVNGHNALRVQQRGSTYAANVQIDNLLPQSKDYYLRYYMKNDDTSNSGDHIVTVDTWNYANLTYLRKYGGPSSWSFVSSMYGCGFTYPISHWGPSLRLANGQWYRFEYYVHYTDATHVQVHPRVYDAAGNLMFSDAQFLQEDYGQATWNGRSDWTLASYYAAGNSFCVGSTWTNDFGLGNNGQYGAADTGQYWYFSGVEIRTDRWPGAVQ